MAYPLNHHPLLMGQRSGRPDACLHPDSCAGVLALAGTGGLSDVSNGRHRKQRHRLRDRAGREAAGGGIRSVRRANQGWVAGIGNDGSSGSGRLRFDIQVGKSFRTKRIRRASPPQNNLISKTNSQSRDPHRQPRLEVRPMLHGDFPNVSILSGFLPKPYNAYDQSGQYL